MATMTKQLPPGLVEASRRTISSAVLGDTMIWTKYSQESNGEYTEVQCKIRPGYANPAHYHTRFEESFTVTSGTLTVGHNGKLLKLSPQDGTVTAKLGDVHSLINDTQEDVEFTCRLEPGDEGFERAMYIMHGLANDGQSTAEGVPWNPVHASLMVDLMDARVVGWGWWLASPVLAFMRRAGQGMGIENALINKYWSMT